MSSHDVETDPEAVLEESPDDIIELDGDEGGDDPATGEDVGELLANGIDAPFEE